MRRSILLSLVLLLLLFPLSSFSQQDYIARYSTFTAFSYLGTPSLNLVQRGFDVDFGVNMRPWITLGGDFSVQSGNSSLQEKNLKQSVLNQLPPKNFLPPGFALAAPYDGTTYTYEAGPQFNYRRLKKFTLFARPALGAIHEDFTARPARCQQPELGCQDILTKVLTALVGPSLSKSDTALFYGFGGGVTWEATHNVGIRVATDFVHYNFFTNLLDGGRNSFRVTVGTKWSFGKNIVH